MRRRAESHLRVSQSAYSTTSVILWLVIRLGFASVTIVSTNGAAAGLFHHEKASWKLSQQTDRFTGMIHRQLRSSNGRLLYQPGAVGAWVSPAEDTPGAWYRIDWGTPVRWQDSYPALVAAGVSVDGPSLINSTGGIVWIPAGELLHARLVSVRLDRRKGYKLFQARGLQPVLDAANANANVKPCHFDLRQTR